MAKCYYCGYETFTPCRSMQRSEVCNRREPMSKIKQPAPEPKTERNQKMVSDVRERNIPQAEVARQHGISKQRLSQILRRADQLQSDG